LQDKISPAISRDSKTILMGAEVLEESEGIIAREAPGNEEMSLCKEIGKTLAGI